MAARLVYGGWGLCTGATGVYRASWGVYRPGTSTFPGRETSRLPRGRGRLRPAGTAPPWDGRPPDRPRSAKCAARSTPWSPPTGKRSWRPRHDLADPPTDNREAHALTCHPHSHASSGVGSTFMPKFGILPPACRASRPNAPARGQALRPPPQTSRTS